ncbi:unnamed protein product [Cyprideis torosa]|uniref:Uncharacterized protein n=1 Tax=Cyprideis torosa TaxID=163714 RepID=A0A7R8WS82_9CRUS|nr:unnamed protein product [Cyprideis torosa]CAG0904570.1 unnamed protein product [Cyprideis torosa]
MTGLQTYDDSALAPSSKDELRQRSPLHHATSAETAELLIRKGAVVNAKDRRGKTPLFVAIENNRHSVVEVLLAHGAEPNIMSRESPLYYGTCPLHHATSAETAELLIAKGTEVNAKDERGKTPLFVAIENNRHSVVDVLLSHGADPNVTHKDVRSPLFVATERGHNSVVDVLLAHGADPNGSLGKYPLHQAQSLETAVLLLKKGAILNSSFQESVLYKKLFTNEKALSSILSAYKSRTGNLDGRNAEGNTLLHLCCEWGNEVVLKCILNEGTRHDLRNNEGKTACEVAIAKGYVHIAAQFPHYFPSVLNSTESRLKQEFEILNEIGEGCYGKVYKVKKKTDGKEYALKCVTISGDSEKMQRSLREVRAAMQLGGDHIVKCYDAWIEVAEDDEKVGLLVNIIMGLGHIITIKGFRRNNDIV